MNTLVIKKGYRWAIIIGVGMALLPVHNRWLTELVTGDGVVGFFLPSFGWALVISSLVFITWNWEKLDWGDKKVYIPLLIIVGAIGLSGITADGWGGKVSPLLMGVSLFAVYLAGRELGKDMFLPLAIGAGIASLGVIIHGLLYPGKLTGGFMFERNYDVLVGYALLGLALFARRYQWLLAGLALMAMFLSGSPEGFFVVMVMTVVVVWRKDWGKKALIAVAPTIILASIWFSIGYGQELYSYAFRVVKVEPTLVRPSPPVVVAPPSSADDVIVEPETDAVIEPSAIGWRLLVIERAITNIKPLGEGYSVAVFKWDTVHNVPLVIVQQLGYAGILAGIVWLWVSFWCLAKTRLKYVWVLVLALSVFDHFIWSQLAPLWWCIIGVSTASKVKSDLVFKGAR